MCRAAALERLLLRQDSQVKPHRRAILARKSDAVGLFCRLSA